MIFAIYYKKLLRFAETTFCWRQLETHLFYSVFFTLEKVKKDEPTSTDVSVTSEMLDTENGGVLPILW